MSCRVYNAASSPRVTQVCDMSLVKGGALMTAASIHYSHLTTHYLHQLTRTGRGTLRNVSQWACRSNQYCWDCHNFSLHLNIPRESKFGVSQHSLTTSLTHFTLDLLLLLCFHLANVSISVAALWQTDRKSIFNK